MKVFADFSAALHLDRVDIVAKFDKQYSQPYSPVTDWWQGARNAVKSATRDTDLGGLPLALQGAARSKQASYKAAFDGFADWYSNNSLVYQTRPSPGRWSRAGIDVKVTPEFIVELNGEPTAIKLWFRRKPALDRVRVDVQLYLLDVSYPDCRVGILEVEAGTLHVPSGHAPGLDVLLEAEAASFGSLWASMP